MNASNNSAYRRNFAIEKVGEFRLNMHKRIVRIAIICLK